MEQARLRITRELFWNARKTYEEVSEEKKNRENTGKNARGKAP